jgi:hypothetical protein
MATTSACHCTQLHICRDGLETADVPLGLGATQWGEAQSCSPTILLGDVNLVVVVSVYPNNITMTIYVRLQPMQTQARADRFGFHCHFDAAAGM